MKKQRNLWVDPQDLRAVDKFRTGPRSEFIKKLIREKRGEVIPYPSRGKKVLLPVRMSEEEYGPLEQMVEYTDRNASAIVRYLIREYEEEYKRSSFDRNDLESL